MTTGPNISLSAIRKKKKKLLTCIATESACETEKVCRYQSQIHPARGGTASIVGNILAKYGMLRQAHEKTHKNTKTTSPKISPNPFIWVK